MSIEKLARDLTAGDTFTSDGYAVVFAFTTKAGTYVEAEKQGHRKVETIPADTVCHLYGAVTCPECEDAEMIEDDHVHVCPACGYETGEV